MVKNVIGGLKDVLVSRLKNLFFMNFILAWIIVNYKITLDFLFKEQSIESRITLIDKTIQSFQFWEMLFFPLLLAMTYIFILPLINLGLNILYDKVVSQKEDEHKHEKLIKQYKKIKETNREKLGTEKFLEREMENEIKKIENEIETERLTNSKTISLHKETVENLKKEKNITKNQEKTITDLKDEIQSYLQSIKKLNDLNNEQSSTYKKESEEQYQKLKITKSEKNDLELKYSNLENELSKLDSVYQDLQQKLDLNKTLNHDLKQKYTELEHENHEIKKNYTELEHENHEIKKNYTELEHENHEIKHDKNNTLNAKNKENQFWNEFNLLFFQQLQNNLSNDFLIDVQNEIITNFEKENAIDINTLDRNQITRITKDILYNEITSDNLESFLNKKTLLKLRKLKRSISNYITDNMKYGSINEILNIVDKKTNEFIITINQNENN